MVQRNDGLFYRCLDRTKDKLYTSVCNSFTPEYSKEILIPHDYLLAKMWEIIMQIALLYQHKGKCLFLVHALANKVYPD